MGDKLNCNNKLNLINLSFYSWFRGHKNIKRQPTGLTKEVFYSLTFMYRLENIGKDLTAIKC